MLPTPSRRARLLVALVIGASWGLYALVYFRGSGTQAGDFTQIWLAAQAVLEHREPYAAVLAWEHERGYANQLGFYYPLPAAVLGLPFIGFEPAIVAALLVALSFSLGAYAATTEGWFPLAAFAGPAAFRTAQNAQLGGLLLAAMFWPRAMGWVASLKPTVGIATWSWRPTRTAVVASATIVLGSLIVEPSWPRHWLATIHGSPYAMVAVARAWFAPLLLLAVLRWRTREGRLLLAIACVPHSLFWCDEMILGAIPRTLREAYGMTVIGWVAFLGFVAADIRAHPAGPLQLEYGIPWLIAGLYLPALVIVLRRSNTGPAPSWVEQALASWHAPRWLAGGSDDRAGGTG